LAVTVDDVKDAVADGLHLSGGAAALEPWWDGVCTRALASALADVRGALIGRGFSQAQLDAWGGHDAFVIDLATFWAATRGGMLEAFDAKFVEKIDRRKDLEKVAVTDDAGGLVGSASVGHGDIKPTPKDPPAFPGGTFTDAEGRFKRW
jgi:hypothetical protein